MPGGGQAGGNRARQLAGTGDRRRFAFQVTGGAFLRLCLAWTDPPPGPGLQNALAVILEGPVNPPKVPGNHDRPCRIDPFDRDNNVQIVRIENPPPGNYLVIVFARNMLRPPQDYALVVTGPWPGGSWRCRVAHEPGMAVVVSAVANARATSACP